MPRCDMTGQLPEETMMFGKKGLKPTSIQTLIGEGARLEGNLFFEGGCHLDGVVHGSVASDKDPEAFLSVSEQGRVLGDVEVPRLALSGTVEGNVVVSDRAELGPTAKVIGDVYYHLVEIAAGAQINGKLIHQASPAVAAEQPKPRSAEVPVLEPELESA